MTEKLTRKELIYMAKVCEQTERFNDMLEYMKLALEHEEELNIEERNLLSVAYKNSVGSKRTSWRILDTLKKKEQAKGEDPNSVRHLELIENFIKKVEEELDKICGEIISTIDDKLFPSATKHESQVFYLKMKGDYYRYMAEYLAGEKKKEVGQLAFQSYNKAYVIATEHMETTDPIRLGLALNFSVFYYEIESQPQKACDLAKTAFDDAISDIESIKEIYYKDSTTIMQLMRDNLTLWTSELGEGGEEKED